ncbi:MAG: glycoside hydrolase domain-containing protein [Pirellulaceae bacterium]
MSTAEPAVGCPIAWLRSSTLNPQTGKRIGGPFGLPFSVTAGTNMAVWVEVHIPASAKPGTYSGNVQVLQDDQVVSTMPVQLTVWPVTLAKTTSHYKDKPYVDKLYWFFVDEPSPGSMEWIQQIGRDIKEYSPSIKFFLTAKYHKELEGRVDVWDVIINRQVMAWNSPGPQAYRDEMKKGRGVIDCVTVNSQTPESPNIFISHGTAMNTRIWTWVTFFLGHQGIEFWETKPAPSVATPIWFGGVFGDGSLFYRGLPEELGVEHEIALPSIRLKILRDAIEDYELLAMLKKQSVVKADQACAIMVQGNESYDERFVMPLQRGRGTEQASHVVWEASPKRLAAARELIFSKLSK